MGKFVSIKAVELRLSPLPNSPRLSFLNFILPWAGSRSWLPALFFFQVSFPNVYR